MVNPSAASFGAAWRVDLVACLIARTFRFCSPWDSPQWKSRERVASDPSIGVRSTSRPAIRCTTSPSRSTRAVHRHQPRAQELAALAVGQVAPDDHVGRAGLVLERDEDDAARGVGPLAADDDAGGAHEPAVRRARDVGGGDEPLAAQLAGAAARADAGRSVRPRRAVVGDDVLAFGRRGQARLRLRRTSRPRAAAAAFRRRRRPRPRRGDGPRAPRARRRRRARPGRGGRAARGARDRRRARTGAARAARATMRCAPASGESGDHAQAEAQRGIRARRFTSPARDRLAQRAFQRAIPVADRHVGAAHFDAVPARVGHELRRRVEAHRLRVEQRARVNAAGS